jgi:sulfur transfer complex TusBCD TusB component (DsrH family)
MKITKKPTVLLERFPYRYVQVGTLEINGMPDYRIQKANEYTKRYSDMYLLDNQMQLLMAMEDIEYTKWLDPDRVPCYVTDDVVTARGRGVT